VGNPLFPVTYARNDREIGIAGVLWNHGIGEVLLFYSFILIITSGVIKKKGRKGDARVPSSPHQKGQGIVEYALILLLAAVVIGMVIYLLLPSFT
jgi:ABC-type Fe3+ transport system permease subunit